MSNSTVSDRKQESRREVAKRLLDHLDALSLRRVKLVAIEEVLKERDESNAITNTADSLASHEGRLVDLFARRAVQLHKTPGAFTNQLALVAARYIESLTFENEE